MEAKAYLRHVLAADEVQNDLNFAGSDPDMSKVSLSFH